MGDPSGRSTERIALSQEILESNRKSITSQVRKLFERGAPFAAKRAGIHHVEGRIDFVNNKDWIGKMSLLDFLSGPGKRARVSTMLARERFGFLRQGRTKMKFVKICYLLRKSVKTRLHSQSGLSFTEFSYQLLQAYDFYHLHLHEACTIQIGGSDQWGNIQSGIEMIRREELSLQELKEDDAFSDGKNHEPAYGLTFPLLTTASGEKFGKSAGNAVWLDERLTSPFEFFQVICNESKTS